MKKFSLLLGLSTLTILLGACSSDKPTAINDGPGCSPGFTSAVTPEVVNLLPLESVRLTLTVFDCGGKPITDIDSNWLSADPTIATVGTTGFVEARSSGNTEIYVVDQEYEVGQIVEVHIAAN